jgi:hypothetical protein
MQGTLVKVAVERINSFCSRILEEISSSRSSEDVMMARVKHGIEQIHKMHNTLNGLEFSEPPL